MPPALEVQSLNHRITRDVPNLLLKKKKRNNVISEGTETCCVSLSRGLTLCKSNVGIETEHLSYLCSCPDKTKSVPLCPLHWGQAWGQGYEEATGAVPGDLGLAVCGVGAGTPGVSCWTVRGSSLPPAPSQTCFFMLHQICRHLSPQL